MHLFDRVAIGSFHRERAREYGAGTVEALGWRHRESQQRRFQALARIGDLDQRSVLDAGCGHGDLLPFLEARGLDVEYTGMDHLADLLVIADQRHGHRPRTRFLLADFTTADLPEVDYVFCSGALNYRNREPNALPRVLEKLYDRARLGFAFNLLRGTDNGILVTHDPGKVLALCRQFAAHVELVEGYHPEDFTLLLRRSDR